MVVIPAGTRNHLALDLGIDRDDVVGALDAFGAAVERPMDLAEVNGHVFVNNVSLGLYGAIVQSPDYRDAKVDTTLSALPRLLGPGSQPMDLRFQGPDGTRHDGAHVVQVSNGPYGTTLATMTRRPRIDTGALGITTLVLPDAAATRRFLAALATNRPDRYEGLQAWSSGEFVIDSGSAVAVGLDGEAMDMEPPLRFSIRPHALRVRLAPNAIGFSPAARTSSARDFLPNLWNVALGRPVAVGG
jgi:diacylglycerol kinase family enzyme